MSDEKETLNENVEQVEKAEKTEKKTKKVEKEKSLLPNAAPRLFFKTDRIEIVLLGYHSKTTGELSFVIPKPESEEKDSLKDVFNVVEYKFEFTRVPYDKLNRYRTRSMIYNSEDQNNTINELRLREFFLVFHLVDWNLTDENGKKIELKFDPNKALSDESLELIYTLPSNLLDVLLTTFEKRIGA